MYRYIFATLGVFLMGILSLAQPAPISLDNIRQLTQITQYGMGAPYKTDTSPDGSRFAVAMGMGGVRIYDTADFSTPLAVFGLDREEARDVDFAPDNKQIAVAYGNGAVILYDGATYTEQWALEEHTSSAIAVDFSPDGTRVVSGSDDLSARVWDTSTGQEVMNLTLAAWGATVAFSPDGTRLIAAERGARLFDTATGEPIADFLTHGDTIVSVAFNPDSTTIATASNDFTIKLWDAVTGEEKTTLVGHDGRLRGVAFDPQNPTHLIASSEKSTVYRWDTTTGQKIKVASARSPLSDFTVLADGRIVAGSSIFGVLMLDAKLQDLPVQTDLRSRINAMALTPERVLAVGYESGEIEAVDPLTRTAEILITGDSLEWGGVRDLAYTPDGAFLVVGYAQNRLQVYDTADYSLIAEAETPKSFSQLVMDAQGVRIGTVGSLTAVYSLPDLALLADLGYTSSTRTFAFSPDGAQLAVGHRTEQVKLFDGMTYDSLNITITGPAKAEYNGLTGIVTEMTYTPDGESLLISWNHYTVGTYDPQTGAPIQETALERDLAQAMIFAPDNAFMMFMDIRQLLVMDWRTVQPIVKFDAVYEGSGLDGFFDPSGTYLYLLTEESIIRVLGIREA